MFKNTKKSAVISLVIALVIVALVAVWLRSGNIKTDFKAASLEIKASYWSDLEISYAEIDSVTYRKDLDIGERTLGIGSARLSVGTFQNDEFGSYTLYAYSQAKDFAVLHCGDKTVVLGMENAKDTQIIYDTVSERIGK